MYTSLPDTISDVRTPEEMKMVDILSNCFAGVYVGEDDTDDLESGEYEVSQKGIEMLTTFKSFLIHKDLYRYYNEAYESGVREGLNRGN